MAITLVAAKLLRVKAMRARDEAAHPAVPLSDVA
jgi:hypothetical protein